MTSAVKEVSFDMIVITLAVKVYFKNGRFYAKDALSVWTNLGKHLLFSWLCVSSIKTGIRIMRLDELSFEIRLERVRTTHYER